MGKVIAFQGPDDNFDYWPLRRDPNEAKWSPDQRHFMRPDTWRMRNDIRLDRHVVTAFEQGGGWRWRVKHIPTGEALWSSETYQSFKAARRGCWAAKWPGKGER